MSSPLVLVKGMGAITTLAALADLGKNIGTQNWTASGFTDMAMDLAPLAIRLKTAYATGQLKLSATILEITLEAVSLLQQLNGIGEPVTGDAFSAGKSKLDQIIDNLKSASPDDGWEGGAADNYGAQDITLKDVLKKIADADQQMAATLNTQALEVFWVRNTISGIRVVVVATLVAVINYLKVEATAAMVARASPSPQVQAAGLARFLAACQTARNWQIGVSLWAIGGGLTAVCYLIGRAREVHEPNVDRATAEYEQAAYDAGLLGLAGTSTAAGAPVTSGSTVSGLPEMSGTMSGAPGTSRSAGAVRSAGDERSKEIDVDVSDPDRDSQAIEPLFPELVAHEAMPSPAASSVPAFGRQAQMSGQAASVSGNPSKRSTQAAATAEQVAAAGEAEGAGAAAGTEAGEQAPITAATPGDTQAHEPSPVQRNL